MRADCEHSCRGCGLVDAQVSPVSAKRFGEKNTYFIRLHARLQSPPHGLRHDVMTFTLICIYTTYNVLNVSDKLVGRFSSFYRLNSDLAVSIYLFIFYKIIFLTAAQIVDLEE